VNFLADESVDAPIVWLLREAGHTVHYVAEMNPGVSDVVVLDLANRETCPLTTADKDFGELVFRQRLLMRGVVLLRLAGVSSQQKANIVLAVIRDHGHELADAFTVVTRSAIRVRKLV
jgi:predicted nuclease of predicted toxin-antitoxin system